MTDKNHSRRRLLKSIAAGSGAVVAGKSLPESWRKPVIDTVVLPTHASTTADVNSSGEEQPACCLTDGTYCDTLGGFDAGAALLQDTAEIMLAIIIKVTADGSIAIKVYLGYSLTYTGNAKVECTGDFFNTTLDLINGNSQAVSFDVPTTPPPPTVSVSGEVKCGVNTIMGKIKIGADSTYDYQASTTNKCLT